MEIRLGWLLGAAWLTGTLPILIASLPTSRLNFFHDLLSGFARRGKTMRSSSHKLTVPQRWFLHFYLWGASWTALLLGVTWHYAYKITPLIPDSLDFSTAATHLTGGSHTFSLHKPPLSTAEHRYRVWVSVFSLILIELHILRRLYESVYVFKYSPSSRMHVLGYFTGFFFYTAAPLSLCHFFALEAVNFAVDEVAELNVKRQEISLMNFNWWGHLKPITKLRCCQWIGAAIFAWGWVHQFICHAILGSLREHREETDEYVIPHGDWFERVSCPHYLAEMIIYLGLLVASGGTDFTLWLLLLFVVVNLAFAAAETQRWYLQKFEDYPRNRRVFLPYIY